MVKAFKGCVNEECIARIKKISYKNTDEFCSKCGLPLSFVCKDCWMELEDKL
ncbi:MAG: hypothetical protein Q4E53_05805 [Eubacteriales bacterium]|nr:hypothetical protein [Eubacteriales bacterium]